MPKRRRIEAVAHGDWRLLPVIGLLALVAVAGVSFAGPGDGTSAIRACVKKQGGWLRVISAGERCRRGERSLSFNRKGPPGPQGPQGPAGGQGPEGSAGLSGPSAYSVVAGGNCADIQTAINGLPSAGGAVLVKQGTYTCDAALVIDRDNVTLRGTGPGTVLKLGNHVNRPVLIVGQTAAAPAVTRHDVRVSDLSIDGNRLQQDFECSTGPCSGGDYLRNNDISLRRVEDVTIDNVSVESARSGGLVVEMGSKRVTVRDFTASDSQFDGLAAYNTEDSLFSGLYLHDNLAAGLSFDNDFNRNTVTDSALDHNGDVGVFMRNARDNVFSAVRIQDSFKDGVFLAENDQTHEPALGNTFTGLVISDSGDPSAPANEGYGIKVADASCTDNLVVATQFVGNRDGDVSEATPGLVTQSATITR